MVASSLKYGYQVAFKNHFWELNFFIRQCQFQYAFLITSAVLFAGGVVVFFALVPSPKEIGLLDTLYKKLELKIQRIWFEGLLDEEEPDKIQTEAINSENIESAG